MFRNCAIRPALGISYTKDMLRKMFAKSTTSSSSTLTDNKVKEHIPDSLEQSLIGDKVTEQELISSRDTIVDIGHKVIKCLDNKAPTPTIAPYIHDILKEYGASTEVISQRSLSYLLYPNSGASRSQVSHELVLTFTDNIKALVAYVEANGTSHIKPQAKGDAYSEKLPISSSSTDTARSITSTGNRKEGDSEVANKKPNMSKEIENTVHTAGSVSDVPEAVDTTMFVKLTAGMALANIDCDQYNNALKCVDLGLLHSTDANRRGGLLAMKAGILNRMKRYDEAAQVAQQAIDVSDNVQGYIQGAVALRQQRKDTEMVTLLRRGCKAHPDQEVLGSQLEAATKTVKLSIVE